MFTLQTKISILRAFFTKNSPIYVQFYISGNCHLKCGMCNIVKANAGLKPLGKEDIEKVADNLIKIGAGVILLTGGEPFMADDIAEAVRIFRLRRLDVRLQTAGLYSRKEKIAKCAEYGARDINVSLDSLDEKKSDYLNGVDGSWKKAIKTISFISKVFSGKDSICALGCVLSRYNINEIDAILDFATRIGWWLSLVPVHITTQDFPLNFRGLDDNFSFRKKDFDDVRRLIKRLKKKKKEGYLLFDSDNYLDSIYHFVSTRAPSWRAGGMCDTPNLYFAILPDGRFAPCCDHRFYEDVYVFDPDFPSVYKSRAFREKIRSIVKKCPGCNFGSYPEITLVMRSFSTFLERVLLHARAVNKPRAPMGEDELYKTISDVKKNHGAYT